MPAAAGRGHFLPLPVVLDLKMEAVDAERQGQHLPCSATIAAVVVVAQHSHSCPVVLLVAASPGWLVVGKEVAHAATNRQ